LSHRLVTPKRHEKSYANLARQAEIQAHPKPQSGTTLFAIIHSA
jgi:hypothetical protein